MKWGRINKSDKDNEDRITVNKIVMGENKQD